MMNRKEFLRAGLAGTAGVLLPPMAWAQEKWPASPVKLVVPFGAGGTTDVVARVVGARMAQALGQPVVIDNRAGAAGAIGADAVAKAAKDGYTMGIATVSTHAINPAVNRSLPYQPGRDFAPVSLLATTPIAVIVHPSVGANTLADLARIAKAQPGTLNFGSPGTGSLGHLAGMWFNQMAGCELTHVPYRSSTPGIQDLLAGRVHVMFENIPTPLPHVRTGALRALAVLAPSRASVLPDVPSAAESGMPDFLAPTWTMLVAPAGTPADVIRAANAAADMALRDDKVRSRLADLSVDVQGGTSDLAAQFLRTEIIKWEGLARKAGIVLV